MGKDTNVFTEEWRAPENRLQFMNF